MSACAACEAENGRLRCKRATTGNEGKYTNTVWLARLLQLFFSFANGGNLRVRIDDIGYDIVIHLGFLARNTLGDHDAFL